jgi:predicted ATPase
VRREDVRLVTLTGPGGTGKTRLALEVAAELVGDFEDGLLWVPLVGLSDPGLVLPTIASTVGAKRDLAEHVGDREILLALDNFEQVAAAAADVAAILSRCPRLRVLTTSREPLHVAGEWEFPVPTLSEDEAVRLFRERAAAVRPSFAANGEVAEICARLDRLPLAIELAAARVKVLEPTEMLARLEHRLPFLTGRGRDVPRHQRTLRATIEWSYELLEPVEQELFRRLSVFAGGATGEATTKVCDATLDGLESLVDKSLIRRAGGRFQMLETIREYALDRLKEAGEAGELRRAHAEYFSQFGERAEAELDGPDQAGWLDALALEHDNVRAALEWCLSGGDPELGGQLASSLNRFWSVRGHFVEGRSWLERALATNAEPPAWLETKLLKVAAASAHDLGDFGRMRELTERRLALARELGDESEVARCLNNLGLIASGEGDDRKAASLLRESILLMRELGERVDIPLGNLAGLAAEDGDTETADALATESLALAREVGDLEQIVHMTQQIGQIRILQGRISEAVELEREVFQLANRLQSKTTFRRCCEDMALLLARQGDLDRAAQLLGKTQALREELGRGGIGEGEPSAQVDPLLANTVARVRGGLSEEARLEALRVGRAADLLELLEAALQDAETTAGPDT